MRFFLIALFVLLTMAMVAGLVGEWLGASAHKLFSATTLLALSAYAGAIFLGISKTIRDWRRRKLRVNDPDAPATDLRPVLVVIWWPITLVAVVTPLMVLATGTRSSFGPGTGLPLGIVLAVGVFGFVSLPIVVRTTWAEFGSRGLHGFLRSFRGTPWGDGVP